jgi:hypothetical protein
MPVFPAPELPDRERAAALITAATPASTTAGPMPPNNSRRGQLRLHRLGWSDEWDARYRMATATGRSPTTSADRVADRDLTQSVEESGDRRHRGSPGGIAARVGRVARIDATGCACLTAAGPVRADLAGPLTPVAGDWALLAGDLLVGLLPRQSAVRCGRDRRDVQGEVVAANAQLVLVVQAFPLVGGVGRTERLLALAAATGAVPVLVLSQVDRASDPDEVAATLADLAIHAQPLGTWPGVEVVAVSTVSGHPAGAGLDRLRALLRPETPLARAEPIGLPRPPVWRPWASVGQTAAVVGPPGSGKSSLVDALSGTRSVPSKTGSILVPLPGGGAVIDTLARGAGRGRESPGDWLADRYATRLRVERRADWRAAAAASSLGRRRARPAAGNA